jgi:hypothetical protein
MADLQAASEAYDAPGVLWQKVKSAMAEKCEAIYAMAAGTPRDNLVIWADEVLKNQGSMDRESWVVLRYVIASHRETETDLAALLALSDAKVQTAVDAYVDDRYNPGP